ncbi:SDR family oxidoreductase [Flavobacterium sp. DSR2-3-3]|uniref:SDR family oxidoreductase n=1 Tax=Flavobacterium sp. DSR2-3-3 TaxID=2804632 RepID=UPI003CF697D5
MVDLIKELVSEAIFLEWDVSKTDERKAMVAQTIAAFGRLDYAFNNSGIEDASASTQDCSEENWGKIIGLNLKAIWLCIKY